MSTCGFELSPEYLPNGLQPNKCERNVWSDDDNRCILHTTADIEDTDQLESEISSADRIDGLQLARKELSEGFIFQEMGIYGADFQNSVIRHCSFRKSDISHARFEGADLSHTTFAHDKQSDSDEHQDTVTNTRSNIRYSNFEDSDISDTKFEKISFLGTEFNCRDMRGVDFIDCSLPNISFNDQEFHDANFSYSVLRGTSFEDCDFHNATFHATVLKETRISESNLRKADLRNAIFDETEFRDVHVDHRTKLDNLIIQEYLADRYSEQRLSREDVQDVQEFLYHRRGQVPIAFEDKISNRKRREKFWYAIKRFSSRTLWDNDTSDYSLLEHARYRYRDFSRMLSENDEPEEARKYTIREKHTTRKTALKRDRGRWLWLSFSRWAMKYGEEPIQPIKTGLGVMFFSALIYPVFGVINNKSGEIISYCLSCKSSIDAVISVAHLSIVRFLSPSNPSIQPVGFSVSIGLFESITGALLIAMFVFTLGRRATE